MTWFISKPTSAEDSDTPQVSALPFLPDVVHDVFAAVPLFA